MSSLTPHSAPPWRSLEEFAGTSEFRQLLENEFPRGAAWLDEVEAGATSLSRRRFIQLMGASFALAGLTNCGRPPRGKIVPYVRQPENVLPGQALYYATALPFRGHARGVLVASHLGRPTKIEGNPDHPSSLGATDAAGQAAVLDLYDPDRARTVRHGGTVATWDAFDDAHHQRRIMHAEKRGRGYAILIEPTSSPTLQRLLAGLLAELPEARIYQHAAVPPAAPAGEIDLSKPDLVVAVDDDFLADHPESLRFARQFAARRRAGGEFNRLYVIEPTPTLTGAMADHRLAVKPSRIAAICRAVQGESVELNPREAEFVRFLRDDLGKHAGHVLVRGAVASGLLAHSTAGNPVPPTMTHFPGLAALATDLTEKRIQTLLILGGNPAYTTPGNVDFVAALAHAEFTAHLGSHEDETSALCQWHLPAAHLLESWGDIRAYDGTPSIQQPLIEPLYQGRSVIAMLAPDKDDYGVIRETWRLAADGPDFGSRWETTVHDGWAEARAWPFKAELSMLEAAPPANPTTEESSGIELVVRPDPSVGAGEGSNNGWLQELPRPFTKLVWDNAALISPALAKRHGLANGDVVTLHPGGVHAPVWILPGQADDTLTVHLGYGRRAAGRLGNAVGFDIYPLVGRERSITLEPTGKRHELVSTQHHSLMEGRDLIWRLTAMEVADGTFPERPPAAPEVTLYPGNDEQLNGRHAWAMSIDLSTCIGCNACVLACQAENNIQVVGKREVARGRHMHWLRIDRYFAGDDPDNPDAVLHQPVTCQHCEKAPCEVVCPVEATVHTADGLNAMVYNRCVGTRYCSNNCPYKVRRFNFFDFRPQGGKADPRSLQANPEVTVRGRGVMEKCTYCVQRIQNAVIKADRENRRVRDGEILTACQQACPAEAIVFGDLRTLDSRVAALRKELTSYALLGELNTRPRTSYLAKTTNPHE